MKIVMISGNGGSGGLIGYINGLLSYHYKADQLEVVIFCSESLAMKLKMIDTPVKIIESKYAKEKGIEIVFNRPLHPEFIENVKNENPDIVFFLNGYIRSGLELFPNVMTLHNQLYIDFFQLIRHGLSKMTLSLIAFRIAVRRSMKRADGVIFLSEFSKTQVDQKKISYNDGIVIPFGFERENRSSNTKHINSNKKIKLIYISALLPYKNHHNLLKACARLKTQGHNIELTLVGKKINPFLRDIEKRITSLNLNNEVIFYDWVDHNEIKSMIDNSDIFVYASSTETTGYGLLEGMARGALIASSNQAGFPSMLKDGGVYFDPKSAESIVKAIEYLICLSIDEKENLCKKALENSLDYSWEKTALKHYEFFKTMALKRQHSNKTIKGDY